MEPVADVEARLAEELRWVGLDASVAVRRGVASFGVGHDASVAVRPEGPMTIPYLRREGRRVRR